jgi:hypothetical protein
MLDMHACMPIKRRTSAARKGLKNSVIEISCGYFVGRKNSNILKEDVRLRQRKV